MAVGVNANASHHRFVVVDRGGGVGPLVGVDADDEHGVSSLGLDGIAPAGTPDVGIVAVPLTSHAVAGPDEVVASFGSQPIGGRAFVRHTPSGPPTLRMTRNAMHEILHQGTLSG